MKRLKVGLLCDDLEVSEYVFQICAHLTENHDLYEPVIVTGYADAGRGGSALQRLLARLRTKGLIRTARFVIFALLYRAVQRLEVPRACQQYPRYRARKSVTPLGLETIHVTGEWSKSGLYLEFGDDALRQLKSRDFDVLVRCGTGILRGGILSVARHGILSFHHGDNRVNRGAPSGFWEVLHDEPSTGFIIQRLSEELDGGEVLCRGNIMTSSFWLLNNAALLEKSNVFMLRILERLRERGAVASTEPPSLHHNPIFKLNESPVTLFRYILKTYAPIVLGRIRRLFQGPREGRWAVAYSPYSRLNTSLFRYEEIPNPDNRFLADPFVITHNGRSVCFAEDYFFEDRKGRVSAIELREDGHEFLGVVLEEDFHLSYPYVLESEGQVYMIPDTHEAKQIRLYKCDRFPDKWTLDTVLMDQVSAVDTTVVKRDDAWYMLTNICSAGIGDHNSELHVFHADSLKSTEWRPLRCGNPVVFDSLRGRNGGMFVENGRLIRVSQAHGKAHYGAGFCLNEVLKLDPEGYREVPVDRVAPKFKDGLVSTHHFHTDPNFSVVDYMRWERASRLGS